MVATFSTVDHRMRATSQIHRIEDKATGLEGVIAIDSLTLGPAAGGCRFWRYESTPALHADAVRLARGMTFKNAMAGLPFGGGKAVLQMPEGPFDRAKLFAAFGEAVQALKGDYISAEDVGTSVADMEAVRSRTAFVAGLGRDEGMAGGDPSPWTALGILQSMKAAARFALGADLSQLRVAVQGAGNVGTHLCGLLARAGAHVIVADIDPDRARALTRLDRVEAVPLDALLQADADIFAPCALGGALDAESVAGLKARLVCGGANNQLANDAMALELLDRGITYVPDYIANAGGIINVAAEYLGETAAQVEERIGKIPSRVLAILTRARQDCCSPALVADEMAAEIIASGRRMAA